MQSYSGGSKFSSVATSVLAQTTVVAQTDLELLRRFATRRDEVAFAELVRRHGPLVDGVCRRILHNPHDAEDALQATFLRLALKAESVSRKPVVLGGWLYTVARRIALRARKAAARREARDRVRIVPPAGTGPDPQAELTWREVKQVIDFEIARLPSKYRDPVVLCFLQGLTLDHAAAQVGVCRTSIRRRLEHARSLLEKRLTRRGLALSAGMTVMLLTPDAALRAADSRALARVAAAWASGVRPHGVSAGVLALSKCANSPLQRLWAVVGGAAVVATACGAGWMFTGHAGKGDPDRVSYTEVASAVRPTGLPGHFAKAAAAETVVAGRVTDPDGQPIEGAQVSVVAPRSVERGSVANRDAVLAHGTSAAGGGFKIKVPADVVTGLQLPGSVKVVAAASGRPIGTSHVTSAGEGSEAEVRLPVSTPVQIRLIGPDGSPAVGVRVTVVRIGVVDSPILNGQSLPCWPATARSDSHGRVTLDNVNLHHGLWCWVQDDRFAYRSIGPSDFEAAADGNLVVRLEPASVLRVQVRSADTGRPLAGVRVTVSPESSESGGGYPGIVLQGESDAAGNYQLSAFPAGGFRVTVFPTDSAPFLPVGGRCDWPTGTDGTHVQTLDLPTGIPLSGTVALADGRPVCGATVHVAPADASADARAAAPGSFNVAAMFGRAAEDTLPPHALVGPDAMARTDTAGRFVVTAPSGKVVVLARGPSDDYVAGPVPGSSNSPTPPGGGRPTPYAHASVALDLKAGGRGRANLDLKIRRGVTLKARVFGADGLPVTDGALVCRSKDDSRLPEALSFFRTADGFVDLPGCDPDRDYPVVVYDGKGSQGGAAILRGRPADPLQTVRLDNCGVAVARFIDAAGRPRGGCQPRLVAVVPPDVPQKPGADAADRPTGGDGFDSLWLDPRRFDVPPPSGENGAVVLQPLVPGVTYRLLTPDGVGWRRSEDFSVRPGQILQLGDIVVR